VLAEIVFGFIIKQNTMDSDEHHHFIDCWFIDG